MGIIDIDHLRDRIAQKVMDAQVEMLPFPHLIAEDFFPEDVYERIQALNPFLHEAGQEWMSQKSVQNVTGLTPYFMRKQLFLADAHNWKSMQQEDRSFWGDIRRALVVDNWFVRLVIKKFPEYFYLRFGDLTESEELFNLTRNELFLQRHEPGYYIGPHTDIPTRIFTCIFSFAAREGFEEFGTELCVPNDKMTRCWGDDHYKPDQFQLAKVAPYKPNNFLLFFKTRQSFHAVRAIDETVPNQRYGMQFQFYEPKDGVFTDLSAPELMYHRDKKIDHYVKLHTQKANDSSIPSGD